MLLRSEAPNGKCRRFTLWQHATMKFTRRDHSIIACSCRIYMGVVLRAHSVRGEHAFNATPTERLHAATTPFFLQQTAPIARSFCEGCTWHDLHILVTAPFLLRSEGPNGKCAKLHTVAASNNRVHPTRSLYYSKKPFCGDTER